MSAGFVIALETQLSALFRFANHIFGYEPHYGEPNVYRINKLDLPELNGEKFFDVNSWFEELKIQIERASTLSPLKDNKLDSQSERFAKASQGHKAFKYHVSLKGNELSVSSNSMFGRGKIEQILGPKVTLIKRPNVSIHAEDTFRPDGS